MRQTKSKKERILDIALKEFGEKGYNAASTNTIASWAGVSKGLIFYQHGSKKDLYLAVVQKCAEDLTSSLSALAPAPDADFYETITKTAQGRTIFFSSHPLHLNILDEAFSRSPAELKAELKQLEADVFDTASLFEKFKQVPLASEALRDRAFELLMMTIDYLQKKYARRSADDPLGYSSFAELGEEVGQYIDLVMNGVRG
ncbi:TetR/AcrR family transcriptional regulator [Oscillospiraceae bacterium OttesenSCG-928-G22]|nr:TetR/AcrR family transcriptional regulator [Oscillospiraceae bacterium OttesenSCG-928-G22]